MNGQWSFFILKHNHFFNWSCLIDLSKPEDTKKKIVRSSICIYNLAMYLAYQWPADVVSHTISTTRKHFFLFSNTLQKCRKILFRFDIREKNSRVCVNNYVMIFWININGWLSRNSKPVLLTLIWGSLISLRSLLLFLRLPRVRSYDVTREDF